jgi:hypothetical protein
VLPSEPNFLGVFVFYLRALAHTTLFFPQLRILVFQSTIQVVHYLEFSAATVWEFDRLGGIASKSFDINKDVLQFVSAILGYLLVSKE